MTSFYLPLLQAPEFARLALDEHSRQDICAKSVINLAAVVISVPTEKLKLKKRIAMEKLKQ